MLNFKKASRWTIVLCSCLLVLFMVGFTTNPRQQLTINSLTNQPNTTARAENYMPIGKPNVDIAIDSNAAVDFIPTSANEITVDYNNALYDVSVEDENGNWKVKVTSDCYYELYSENGYKDCNVIVENAATFGEVANESSGNGHSRAYTNGTGAGVIKIDLSNNGYAIIENTLIQNTDNNH